MCDWGFPGQGLVAGTGWPWKNTNLNELSGKDFLSCPGLRMKCQRLGREGRSQLFLWVHPFSLQRQGRMWSLENVLQGAPPKCTPFSLLMSVQKQ